MADRLDALMPDRLKYAKAGVTPASEFYDVFLDGKKLDGVTEASTIDGLVIMCERDAFGNFVSDRNGISQITMRGNVEIIRQPRDAGEAVYRSRDG